VGQCRPSLAVTEIRLHTWEYFFGHPRSTPEAKPPPNILISGAITARTMALTSGTKLGPYEIQSPLGAGGMGEVYRARDTRLDREVATKLLPTHLSQNPDLRARFEREAKAPSLDCNIQTSVCFMTSAARMAWIFWGWSISKGKPWPAASRANP
jgi:serine/threonine protein kinase